MQSKTFLANSIHLLLAILAVLLVFAPGKCSFNSNAELHFGLIEASVGVNPQTGRPSGWYISDVTLPVSAPATVLANGQVLNDGKLVVSDEGRHQIAFQAGPLGWRNAVTQFVNLDKTPPRIVWQTEPNTVIPRYATLSAEIVDPISGICVTETSLDRGRTWQSQFFPAPLPGERGPLQVTTWSQHLDSRELMQGMHRLLLRAHDCAGNVSLDEALIFWVK